MIIFVKYSKIIVWNWENIKWVFQMKRDVLSVSYICESKVSMRHMRGRLDCEWVTEQYNINTYIYIHKSRYKCLFPQNPKLFYGVSTLVCKRAKVQKYAYPTAYLVLGIDFWEWILQTDWINVHVIDWCSIFAWVIKKRAADNDNGKISNNKEVLLIFLIFFYLGNRVIRNT